MLFIEKPKIGISLNCSAKDFNPDAPGDSAKAIAQLIVEAGGEAIYLPFAGDQKQGHADAATIDGLVIAGGAGVPESDLESDDHMPNWLDETPLAKRLYDARLFSMVRARRYPVLGICYGMQMINLFLNGTIKKAEGAEKVVAHSAAEGDAKHKVTIDPSTFLYRLLETEELEVVSRHRQAVDGLNDILVPAAVADDEIVEAIEPREGCYLLGLQWHPEADPESDATKRLFDKLVWYAQRVW